MRSRLPESGSEERSEMVWPYIAQRTVETAAAWGRWGTMLKTSASAMADPGRRSESKRLDSHTLKRSYTHVM